MTFPPLTARVSRGQSPQSRFRHIALSVLFGVLYSFFGYSFFMHWLYTGSLSSFLFTLQETILVSLIISRRRSFEETNVFWEWCVAIRGTGAPLLLRPGTMVTAFVPLGEVVQMFGVVITIVALLSLRRSFGVVAANRGVRTGGLYRFVRHPLYGSYIIGYAGFLLVNITMWNVLLVALMFFCQYLRAHAEERILLRDPMYQAYAANVQYRFIPFIF